MLKAILDFASANSVLFVVLLMAFLYFCNIVRLTIRPPLHCSCQAPSEYECSTCKDAGEVSDGYKMWPCDDCELGAELDRKYYSRR